LCGVALKPFCSFFAASLATLRRSSLYGAVSRKEKRLLGFQVQGHFVRQTKNALPSSFQKLSRAFCSLSNWKATCKPPVPFDGNEQLAEKSCYHFAIKSAVANQKVVISLGLFCPKYHEFFIPTRSRQAYSKQVCLWDLAQIICITFIIQVAWAI